MAESMKICVQTAYSSDASNADDTDDYSDLVIKNPS